MLWEQGVEGSNPFAPTTKIKELHARNSFFYYICNHIFSFRRHEDLYQDFFSLYTNGDVLRWVSSGG